MFIKYQNVRNVLLVGVSAVLGGIAWISYGCTEKNRPELSDASSGVASRQEAPSPAADEPVVPPLEPAASDVDDLFGSPPEPAPRAAAPLAATPPEVRPDEVPPPEAFPLAAAPRKEPMDPMLTRYRAAMRIAEGPADPSGKGSDVLGPGSPWKLNLYDDDKDGRWDRGKLDYHRDEEDVDDEKWNFKNGRWEKEGGATIWDGSNWIGAGESGRLAPSPAADQPAAAALPPAPRKVTAPPPKASPVVPPKKPSPVDPMLARYRAAMRIAEGPADPSGKGKDVLGPGSPWKLNLYDDDKDGKWERGKLDYDRDEVDDEKWNFKKGRWEKEGGAKIWDGSNWIGPEE